MIRTRMFFTTKAARFQNRDPPHFSAVGGQCDFTLEVLLRLCQRKRGPIWGTTQRLRDCIVSENQRRMLLPLVAERGSHWRAGLNFVRSTQPCRANPRTSLFGLRANVAFDS